MKNLIYIAIACFIISSCDKPEDLGFEDFYDSYLINNLFINADKIIFFEGDPPVTFTAEAFDETENAVVNFDFDVIINETDTLEGKTFSPRETGRYLVHAVANNVESPRIAIDYINPSDITNLNLYYQGYQYLTTEPWSVTGDFILTTSFPDQAVDVEITRSNIPLTISDGRTSVQKEGLRFSEAGHYEVFVDFNGIRTESVDIIVREAKTYEPIDIPVVFHYVNQNPNLEDVEKAIRSYNDVFNNQSIGLSSDASLAQWDNPNWVNAGMSFSMVSMSDISSLEFDGINVISTQNPVTTKTDFDRLANNHILDPNKYLNIFVTEDIDITNSTRPIIVGSAPILEGLSTVETAESRRPYILNYSEPYNSFTMGEFWGLLQTEGCRNDFAKDTYSYIKDGSDPYRTSNCFSGGFDSRWRTDWDTRICLARSAVYFTLQGDESAIAFDCNAPDSGNPAFFYLKNIMDRNGPDNFKRQGTLEFGIDRFRSIITHDQRERMRTVIEYSKFRPTKRNR